MVASRDESAIVLCADLQNGRALFVEVGLRARKDRQERDGDGAERGVMHDGLTWPGGDPRATVG